MKRKMVFGLLFGVIAAGGFALESDGIFSYKVGQFEVFMLVESERDGNASIIPTADTALLNRYIPAAGFKHSTNAFLIKAPGQIILVDTGTGGGDVILQKMKTLGVEPDQVDAVLITHLHGDHFGSLQRNGNAVFSKAKIYLSFREHDHFTRIAANQGAVAALAPYGSRVETFEPGELGSTLREILPGVSPIAAYGHTPGHTVFLIENGGARLIIIGDLLHVALIQFPRPDISATYDMDQGAAAAVRRQILDHAVKNNIPVAGMHVVYPGLGTVEADGTGYRFAPAR